jgi:hypothetical protein
MVQRLLQKAILAFVVSDNLSYVVPRTKCTGLRYASNQQTHQPKGMAFAGVVMI